jgi:hypothetical protein
LKKYPTPTRYYPQNPHKYIGDISAIIMRSSWEKKFAHWCDLNPSVLKWGSEIKAIPYFSTVDKRVRRYFPDFWVLLKMKDDTEQRMILEIKPMSQTMRPRQGRNRDAFLVEMKTWIVNQDKWKAASEWANKMGFSFRVITEKDLGITK